MAGSESGRELLQHREPGVEGSAGVLPEMWDVHVGTISVSKTRYTAHNRDPGHVDFAHASKFHFLFLFKLRC